MSEFTATGETKQDESQIVDLSKEEDREIIVSSLDEISLPEEIKENEPVSKPANEASLGDVGKPQETSETTVEEVADKFKSLSTQNEQKKAFQRQLADDSYLTSDITFNDPSLQLPKHLRDALILEMKFDRPTRIQRYALPIVLRGDNLIAQAQTSAGKTVAFVIAMLNRIDTKIPGLQALCLTPTRELANQIVNDAVIPLSKFMPDLRIVAALKGNPEGNIAGTHLIVGTPGTVLSWLQKGYFDFYYMRTFVLDEADEMVNVKTQGSATLKIKSYLPLECQVLLFSATYTTDILAYAKRIVQRATVITLGPTRAANPAAPHPGGRDGYPGRGGGRGGRGGPGGGYGGPGGGGEDTTMIGAEALVLDVIKQVWIDTSRIPGGKEKVLKDIYSFLTIQQSIVFVATKASANEVARIMTESGFEVSTLHSELEGPQRDDVMAKFRSGESKVLITTNVLARGVDVPSVAVVVNYDIPTERKGGGRHVEYVPDHATYLHRIGRTGRFNRAGTAITFVQGARDLSLLKEIERTYAPGREMIQEWDANNLELLGEEQLSRMDKFSAL